MAEKLLLEIASPERLLVKEEVTDVQVPAESGYLGVYPGHAPLIAQLAPGELVYNTGTRKGGVFVGGGYVEIRDDQVRILADSAENADEIDLARAEAALKRSMDRMSSPEHTLDAARAANALRRAEARLRMARNKPM